MTGRISEAIDTTQSLYPGLLDQNSDLFFKLKCRQFIEMVNGCDGEVKTYAHSPSRSVRNSPCPSPSRAGSSSIVSNMTSSSSSYVHTNRDHQACSGNVEQPNGVSRNGNDDDAMLLDECTSNGVCETSRDNIEEDGVEAMDTSDEMKCSGGSSGSSSAVSVITNSSKGELSVNTTVCNTSNPFK